MYGKWDEPEEDKVAFQKVRSGEWDEARFVKWLDHYRAVLLRDAAADESY
jgi:hypothetical protein